MSDEVLLSNDPTLRDRFREKIAELAEDIRAAKKAERVAPAPGGARPPTPPTLGDRMQIIEDRVAALEAQLIGAVNVAERLGQLEERTERIDERLTRAADWVAAVLKALERKKIAVVRPHPRTKRVPATPAPTNGETT